MTGRFKHFDVRPGRSYRLVLAYADASGASPPLPSSSPQCCETASGQNTDRECWRESLFLSLLAVRVAREERQEPVQRHGEITPGGCAVHRGRVCRRDIRARLIRPPTQKD